MQELQMTKSFQKYRNIPVKQDTFEELVKLGTWGDTGDTLIRKLLQNQNLVKLSAEESHSKL